MVFARSGVKWSFADSSRASPSIAAASTWKENDERRPSLCRKLEHAAWVVVAVDDQRRLETTHVLQGIEEAEMYEN